MSTTTDGKFTGAAGGKIAWRAWIPESAPDAVVVLVHGIAEHSGRYDHVARRLNRAGYAVYALDHRGHGRSDGTRGNIDRMNGVVADVGKLVDLARGRHPDLPRFMVAHSMGSMIALRYTTDTATDLAGVVLSAPPLEITVGSAVERMAARVLTVVWPNLAVLKLDSSMVSRDPDVVHDYDTDPLNYRGGTRVRSGAELLATADLVKKRLDRLTIPVLVLQGSADQLVSPKGAELVAAGAGSDDVTLKMYDGLYHEVFNEPEKDEVLDDVVSWLDAHR